MYFSIFIFFICQKWKSRFNSKWHKYFFLLVLVSSSSFNLSKNVMFKLSIWPQLCQNIVSWQCTYTCLILKDADQMLQLLCNYCIM